MENNLTYTRNGDYLIPDLKLSEQTEKPLGKYGRMRKAYLKEHRPILYNQLLMSEKLYPHLLEIDETANSRLEQMMPRLAESAGATEALKARDPMVWVGLMNTCKAQAEEILLAELINS
ncbi:TnpV protein [Pseudoflavonifractor phocaeensis]|uniref:TnpV protein n=1 Tax=Pseudoflavonifractor phocaeensis TaxID=1870988 RepID=UPI001FAF5E30|nr:TnpV protein [Pseudoflavonifractor phocaeensis]